VLGVCIAGLRSCEVGEAIFDPLPTVPLSVHSLSAPTEQRIQPERQSHIRSLQESTS
jgi:hypothetical protein